MPERCRVPSGWEATRAIAAIVLLRAIRGRALWIAVGLALVPLLPAAFHVLDGERGAGLWREIFTYGTGLLALVPPLLVASSIGDDLEDRTASYLWSRPLPRWSLVTGTLLAMAPLALGILATSLGAAYAMVWAPPPPVAPALRALGALALGVAAISAASAALATWSPRFATALAVAYVLFLDLPLSVVPVGLRELSVTHQVLELAAVGSIPAPASGAVIALVGIAAAWLGLAVWRVRRVD